MKKCLSILFGVIALALQSCHFGTSGSWKDDHIDPAIRAQIAPLNKKLFTGLMTNNIAAVKQLMSQVLIEKLGKKTDTIVNTVNNAFKATDYEVLNEFYTKNTTTNISNTLFSGLGDSDYIINYLALNEEMYTSVMISKNQPANCLILAIYGKYGKDWKLNILQIGEYSILNKTAQDYYESAKSDYRDRNMVDASDEMIMASELANPGGGQLKYKNEAEMKDFFDKVLKEANGQYQFPITVNQIKTKPRIFAINPQFIAEKGHEGIFPFIKYKSDIPLKDTVALKGENMQLQKIVGSIFKGIDQNKSYILYKAYEELPVFNSSYDPNKPVKQYGFIQKLK